MVFYTFNLKLDKPIILPINLFNLLVFFYNFDIKSVNIDLQKIT